MGGVGTMGMRNYGEEEEDDHLEIRGLPDERHICCKAWFVHGSTVVVCTMWCMYVRCR